MVGLGVGVVPELVAGVGVGEADGVAAGASKSDSPVEPDAGLGVVLAEGVGDGVVGGEGVAVGAGVAVAGGKVAPVSMISRDGPASDSSRMTASH